MRITVETMNVRHHDELQFESCGGETCGNCEPSCESCCETLVPSGLESGSPVSSVADLVGVAAIR